MSEIERAIEKKEYIERGAALELFWEYSGNWNLINAIPDADVEEVVHGRWIDNQHWEYANDSVTMSGDTGTKCSVCQVVNFTGIGNQHTAYCPNCGAKMDGEKEGV